MLETETRVSRMPSKHCPAGPYPQPCVGISGVRPLGLESPSILKLHEEPSSSASFRGHSFVHSLLLPARSPGADDRRQQEKCVVCSWSSRESWL